MGTGLMQSAAVTSKGKHFGEFLLQENLLY